MEHGLCIYAVVVTFNRVNLLKKAIDALKSQTHKLDKILIVNNASTDDTASFLQSISNDSQVQIENLESNIGGAGGFNIGLRRSIEGGADWVWMMDDDTEPTPQALEKLLSCRDLDSQIGFLSSRVLWKNGDTHLMNVPGIRQDVWLNGVFYPFDKYINQRAFPIWCASFVSYMVKTEVVKQVGLPIKEFFIWLDDYEFTTRINQAGYFGLYVHDSVVIHQTEKNEAANIANAAQSQAWKFFYEMRNRMYFERINSKHFWTFYKKSRKIYKHLLNEINKRGDDKEIFIDNIKRGFKAGLSFKPQIEYFLNK